MIKNKILVLGASGMAGHMITLYFHEKGYDVTTLTRKNFNVFPHKNIVLDVFERDKLASIINESNFDVIINCVGILNEFADNNPDKAIYLNSYLPHYLSSLTKNSKTKIIQMSTDCVFSGKKGKYKEYDFKDGETLYDKSKALGEISNKKDLTFRNSIIGPDLNENGIGLFNWFMKQEGVIQGYSKAIWSGVTTLTLAKAMEQAIIQDLTGIYNLVNNQNISKYALLKLFNKYFRNNIIKIEKTDKVIIDKSLLRTRTDFKFNVPSYEEMIEEMFEWVSIHKNLYNSYKL